MRRGWPINAIKRRLGVGRAEQAGGVAHRRAAPTYATGSLRTVQNNHASCGPRTAAQLTTTQLTDLAKRARRRPSLTSSQRTTKEETG